MTPLKIGIVEDDLIVGKTIYVMLQQMGYKPVKAVRNYNDALKMLSNESPDLLLIDIILDSEKDGIQLADTVNKEFGIPFIFLTANSDTATVNRAKEVKPYAYLVKPFYENDLYSSIEIAFNNFNQQKKLTDSAVQSTAKLAGSIFIKEGTVFNKVELSDIIYLESDHVYLNIYTSQKQYIVRSKLEDFVADYSSEPFLRIHRSYAIHLKHLESINELSVEVKGKEIPLSQNYRQQLMEKISSLK